MILHYLSGFVLSVTVILGESCSSTSFCDEGNDNNDTQPYLCSPVKPAPSSDLEAVSLPNKTLSVSWKRPHLPAYDLQYELRYVPMHVMADLQWKVRKDFSCTMIM